MEGIYPSRQIVGLHMATDHAPCQTHGTPNGDIRSGVDQVTGEKESDHPCWDGMVHSTRWIWSVRKVGAAEHVYFHQIVLHKIVNCPQKVSHTPQHGMTLFFFPVLNFTGIPSVHVKLTHRQFYRVSLSPHLTLSLCLSPFLFSLSPSRTGLSASQQTAL